MSRILELRTPYSLCMWTMQHGDAHHGGLVEFFSVVLSSIIFINIHIHLNFHINNIYIYVNCVASSQRDWQVEAINYLTVYMFVTLVVWMLNKITVTAKFINIWNYNWNFIVYWFIFAMLLNFSFTQKLCSCMLKVLE